MNKFKCYQCGNCCKNLMKRGKKRHNPDGQLVPDEKLGLTIFNWEVETLKKLAKENNIKLILEPQHGLVSKEGILIIACYQITHNNCPFLINNKCSIHKNRPIACRVFPLMNSGLYETISDVLGFRKPTESEIYIDFRDCNNNENLRKTLDFEINKGNRPLILLKRFIDIFGLEIIKNEMKKALLNDLLYEKIGYLNNNNFISDNRNLQINRKMTINEFMKFKKIDMTTTEKNEKNADFIINNMITRALIANYELNKS
jgi:Fe-S-cluster containining protein